MFSNENAATKLVTQIGAAQLQAKGLTERLEGSTERLVEDRYTISGIQRQRFAADGAPLDRKLIGEGVRDTTSTVAQSAGKYRGLLWRNIESMPCRSEKAARLECRH